MSDGITYHICGVDGGGTGCRAVIARPDGTIVGRGAGGPANYLSDPDRAVESVLNAVRQAAMQMGGDAPPLKALVAHVGIAGIMDQEGAIELARVLPFDICTTSDDRETSALGALGPFNGVLLAVGTGSFAVVQRGDSVKFVGGWGFKVGDQASGAWLGRALLEYCLLAREGLETASELTSSVLARFDGVPANIISHASTAGPAEFASFAPQIVSAAEYGDPVGVWLMERGAAYLNSVLRIVEITEGERICLIGGLGPHYARYIAPEYRERIFSPKGTALDGALELARRNLEAQGATL